jgi:hypothetical protein
MNLPRFVSTNQPTNQTFFMAVETFFTLFSGATTPDEIGDGNLLYFLELQLWMRLGMATSFIIWS